MKLPIAVTSLLARGSARYLIALLVWGLLIAVPVVAQDDKPITLTLEISPDPQGQIGSQQRWMKMLHEVGADRVRTVGGRGEASIEEQEIGSGITIRVRGFLSKNKLELPGGKFSISDKAGIRRLLDSFRKDGAEVTLSEKKAFGLTAKQLVWVHGKLSAVVEAETKGQSTGRVVDRLGAATGMTIVKDQTAASALAGNDVVAEEYKGLSAGTALAATLRPLGLVLEPVRKQANDIELHIKGVQSSQEHWPVGWPSKQVPVKTEPRMFERMPIQIKNFALDKVLVAVQKKAQVPFLIDRNTLAGKGIELSEVKVTVVDDNITIARLLSELLRQSRPKMGHELRIDERGTAFVWISSR